MTLETLPFDAAKYLATTQSQAELIADALESGDAATIAVALGVVARARGMAEVAREAGGAKASFATRVDYIDAGHAAAAAKTIEGDKQ